MIINALIINSPNSPHISLESYLPLNIPHLECSSSSDDDSDHILQPISDLNNSTNDSTSWHNELAKSLVSMYEHMHAIITGFEEKYANTKANLQQNKIRLEMMRMALTLNPFNLLTHNHSEENSPYIDVDDSGSPVVEQTCYHDKLRCKIDRTISQLKRGMNKLRSVLFNSSYHDTSSTYVCNYRIRIERSLSKIRRRMIELNRRNQIVPDGKQDDEFKKFQNTIKKIFIKNPLLEQRVEEFRTKLRLHKCVEKSEFISSPLVRLEFDQKLSKIENNKENHFLQTEPLEFPDLNREFNSELSILDE